MELLLLLYYYLSSVQTDATLLANNSQHCWMLHVASVCTPCCMLLDVVACCCAKFETGQTFQPTTPNISFVPWLPKHSKTTFRQHCWRNNVGSCCVCLPAALVTSVNWHWYPCSSQFCAPNRLNESPDLLWISLQPPWQIDNGILNRPITTRTQIQVHRWGPRTRISALLHRLTKWEG